MNSSEKKTVQPFFVCSVIDTFIGLFFKKLNVNNLNSYYIRTHLYLILMILRLFVCLTLKD